MTITYFDEKAVDSWSNYVIQDGNPDEQLFQGRDTSYTKSGYRSSVSTPGFRTLKRSKVRLQPNPFEFHLTETKYLKGSWIRNTPLEHPGQYSYYNSVFSGNLAHPGLYTNSAYQDAPYGLRSRVTLDLLGKIKDQKANIPELIATQEQTIKMFVDTATSIAKAGMALKRGQFAEAARALGAPVGRRSRSRYHNNREKGDASGIANGWLALQYGWKPLLSDLHGACDVLFNHLLGSDGTVTVKSRKRHVDRFDGIVSDSVDGSHHDRWTSQELVETYLTISCTFVRPHGLPSDFAQLGITNPLSLAWELVPFSFVVDWFLPVGNFLSSLDATVGLEFVSGYETLFSKYAGQSQRNIFGAYSNYVDAGHFNGSKTEVFCKRKSLSGFPMPYPPAFKNPLGVEHVLNAMALLHQTFKKK